MLGSFAGSIIETLYHLVRIGEYECRSGMVFGVFTPVYGIGALVMYIGLCKLDRTKKLHIFMFGMLASTAIEFVCSWGQEMLLGSTSWDYSNAPFNIGGRVCLLFSVFWGILAVMWSELLQPLIDKAFASIPPRIIRSLTLVLLIFFVADALISVIAVARWGMRLSGVPAVHTFQTWIDSVFPNSFMEKIYPNMRW